MASLNFDLEQNPLIIILNVLVLGATPRMVMSLKISRDKAMEEGEGDLTMEIRRVLQVRMEGRSRRRFIFLKSCWARWGWRVLA